MKGERDEQTIGDASTGAEKHHLEEAEEPDGGEGEASDAEEDERSPWAE